MKKTLINAALAVAFGSAALSAQAAAVNNGDTLTINAGITATDTNGNPTQTTVSWFGMDTDGNSKIAGAEKTALSMGTNGIVIGTTTTQGASHPGAPASGDTNSITAPWNFFGNTGSDYVTTAVTGSTTAGLNMSGWVVTWAGIPAINMGGTAWGTGFSSGIGNFVWSGVYGTAYTLDYAATVPVGDASGFGGVKYKLHLEGTVTEAAPAAVPVPAAAWLLGSGLLGLVGVARRRKQVA